MKRKKLQLEELEVKSFIIPIDHANFLKGRAEKTGTCENGDGPITIRSETDNTQYAYCTRMNVCDPSELQLCAS